MDFKKIEKKWQKKWEKSKIFQVKEASKKKFFTLEMFPYPSHSSLHMGHAFNYIVGDIYARFRRMQGFNVLYPMGYDSFGLPAENAAIKSNIHPRKYTETAIAQFIKQQKSLGLSYDWSKMIKTSSPDYYKWSQYFFLKFFENGLAYRKKSNVNWCSKCDTVLANEQVHGGRCWRHPEQEVEIRRLEQWFIKTTKYADELLIDIEKLDWPNRIKLMQENWIGKSEGTLVKFKLKNTQEFLEIFTTRIDTIFSVTFLVMAPDHPKALELVKRTKYEKPAEEFIKKVARTSEKVDISKEGFFTGKYAINPATRKEIPIYLANFVVMNYGTGIVMADAHDQRDYEFAKKYKIPLIQVLKPRSGEWKEDRAFEGFGILYNSEQFNGLTSEEAIPKIRAWLEKKELARKEIQYKLRDWLISRQRYWGTPIPIIYCENCGIVPIPEKDLPVLLPEKVKFGRGNPLETNKKFIEIKCPKCKSKARRETDTMDTFFDSSWYFLRYIDNKNKKKPFEKKKIDYWMPVDQYIGGAEHAVMHLIYARFFVKALRDLGFVDIDEPFLRLFNQGMLHGADGFVMSKSRGNVVLPEKISDKYGIDTARLFLVSIASPDKDLLWSDDAIEGSFRFLNKIVNVISNIKIGKTSERFAHKLNKTIEELAEDIENFRYNLGVIKLRSLFDSLENEISKKDLGSLIKLLAPFCPHLAEEFWEKIGNKPFVSMAEWPKADADKINEVFDKIDEVVDKTLLDINNILRIIKEKQKKDIEKIYLYVLPKEKEFYSEEELAKRTGEQVKVYAVNEKDKYDPEGKAAKAKPGKPAIYVE